MPKRPSRIDLLELDIDLRLADLWREAAEIEDWNLEVVAAFMRAAYGKGYCDALTEDSPGSLCEEHGYRVPARRAAAPPEAPPATSIWRVSVWLSLGVVLAVAAVVVVALPFL